jgi:hypothetical protein
MSDWTYVVSKSQLKAEKAAKKAMELEIANAAAKAAKKAKEFQKAVEPFKAALATSTVDYKSLVDKKGYPRPVEMSWPSHGSNLIPYELEDYPQIVRFLSGYTVPIYDIRIKEYTDMGYVPGYNGRRPYTDSLTIRIITFASKDLPIIHEYDVNVHRVPKKDVHCYYTHSYVPSFTEEYYDESEFDTDCWIQLANLNSATQ